MSGERPTAPYVETVGPKPTVPLRINSQQSDWGLPLPTIWTDADRAGRPELRGMGAARLDTNDAHVQVPVVRRHVLHERVDHGVQVLRLHRSGRSGRVALRVACNELHAKKKRGIFHA